MNKLKIKNIVKILFQIIIVFSSGCVPSVSSQALTVTNMNISTVQPSQTLVPIIATSTPIFCVSYPKTPMSDTEKIAEEWFLASQPLVTERDEYIIINSWEDFCDNYKEADFNQTYWINSPIELALQATGYPHPEDSFPTSVYAVTMEKRSDVMTITILEADTRDDSVKAIESRIDLIKIDLIWQIYWKGFRLRCHQSSDWVTESCS